MVTALAVRLNLFVIGFMMSVFGIATYANLSVITTVQSMFGYESPKTPIKLASVSCTTEKDDIVFLSCGGIF